MLLTAQWHINISSICVFPGLVSVSRYKKRRYVSLESLLYGIVVCAPACRFKGRCFEFVFVLLFPELFTDCGLTGRGCEAWRCPNVFSVHMVPEVVE